MKLIVGLGNPGPKYENTRHNAGYMIIDIFAKQLNADEFKPEKKFNSLLSTVEHNDEKILLAKPTTFMNLSGQSVLAISQFYKIDPSNIWVIYDDVDLPLGQIRIRKDGGPGTHNGMESIITNIGQNFPRFRFGIESRGVTSPEQQDISSFVLSPFTNEELEIVKKTLKKAAEALKTVLEEGIIEAMNKYNS